MLRRERASLQVTMSMIVIILQNQSQAHQMEMLKEKDDSAASEAVAESDDAIDSEDNDVQDSDEPVNNCWTMHNPVSFVYNYSCVWMTCMERTLCIAVLNLIIIIVLIFRWESWF